jgi:hypothetical protein
MLLKVRDLMNIKFLPNHYVLKLWTREAKYEPIQPFHKIVRFMQHEALLNEIRAVHVLEKMQHEANDGGVQTQVLLDSTHEAQNSFAFTSFTIR